MSAQNDLESEKPTVTKKKLINMISQETNLHPNEVRQVIQSFLDKTTASLSKGERLELRDFGVFEVVTRRRKIGRNPKNPNKEIIIPERSAVKFTAGKKMKRLIETNEG